MHPIPASRLATLVGDLSRDRAPVYAALAARLRMLVGDGRLAVGVRLPAERDLAVVLRLSRATVSAAYRRLREDGWAAGRQGSGTWTCLPAGPALGAWAPTPTQPGVLDLAHAAPPAPPQVTAAFTAALSGLPRLLPGHGYHPQGLPELRAGVADRYTARGLPTLPEQVLITAGALHGLTLALQVVAGRGVRVLVEHPTYPNALDAIRAVGARPVPVAVSLEAPDAVVADLHRATQAASPGAAYLMPDFQNPTGMLLGVSERRRVAAGLEQAGVTALVDETLADLGLDAQPPAPFAAVARPDLVVSVGSLSKSCWGGLRVGWLRAEPAVARRLATAAARLQLSGPVLEQLAACHLLNGLDAVLAHQRARLTRQRDALLDALARHLPGWHVPVPPGGQVLWCRLPAACSSALVAAADGRGLRLAAGPRFGTGHAFEDRLRLPYTQPVDVLERAVKLLTQVVGDLSVRRPVQPPDHLVV